VRQEGVRFYAKNGGACAIEAGKMKKMVLSWVTCTGQGERDSVSDLRKVGRSCSKLSGFGYKLMHFWGEMGRFWGVFEGAFSAVRTDLYCLECLS